VYSYYSTHDSSTLRQALPLLNRSVPCAETKTQAITLKVSVFSLLGLSNEAISFIDSLDEKDFDRQYKKDMYLAFFRARLYQSKGQQEKSDSLLANAARVLQHYIDASKKFDTLAYGDLYFIKSFFLKRDDYLRELDSASKKDPKHKFLFEALKNESEDSVSSAPVRDMGKTH
jgi:hypothetical protein